MPIPSFAACGLSAAMLLIAAPPARAQAALTTLWNFSGPDGATEYGGLVLDRKGNLYGVTGAGGANGMGHAYELSPPAAGGTSWTSTPIWDFSGGDGNYSETTLLRGPAGNFYGTMETGGGANDGVVFELIPPKKNHPAWSEQTLWSFSGPDGANPFNGLALDAAGNLYGATAYGGMHGSGAVFEVSPPANAATLWTETTIWSFGGPEGETPVGVPFLDSNGNLLGAAQWGGPANAGTIYQLSPPANGQIGWSAAAMTTFSGAGGDGMTPYPALLHSGFPFFGTTLNGGAGWGTVFQLNPPSKKNPTWQHKTIWSFSNSDGCCAFGKLLADAAGALYGTAGFGGPNNAGTVFKLAPPAAGQTGWTETILWTFSGADGANPGDALIADQNGVLYGTTGGGGTNNMGTVFSISGAGFAVAKARPHSR